MLNYYKNIQSLMIRLFSMLLLIATIGLPIQVIAQESSIDVNKLSKELVNPVGPNWLINTYLNVTEKKGDITNKSRTATEWLIQPVLPIPLDDKKMGGLTLMNRPTLPVILKEPVPQTNTMGRFSEFDNVSGIGDLMIQTAIGSMPRAKFGMYMWGVGVALMFPTASKDNLGSEKYSAGPSGMLVGFTEKYTFGVVASHIWSYAGDGSRKNVNQTQIQPLYYMQLGNGWQIGDNPTSNIRWDMDNREKYNVPLGLGIFKTTIIGNTPWRLGLTPRYFFKNNENWGNNWGVSFTITPVFKNPFIK